MSVCASCASVDNAARPLVFYDFPKTYLNYQVIGDHEKNRLLTLHYLSKKEIPCHQEIQEPFVYVITAYLYEPVGEMDNRIRRTAFRVSLQKDQTKRNCTNVSLTWLVQSRGIRERTWRTLESDTKYVSSYLDDVIKLFIERQCK